MKIFVLLIASLLYLGDNPKAITIKVTYERTEDNEVWTKGIDKLTLKSKNKVVTEVLTNNEGYAKVGLDSILKYRSLDIFMTSIGMEELYLQTIGITGSSEIEITLPKKYELRNGFAVCPKCHKNDKVLRAVYGDNQLQLRVIKKGDTSYTNKIGKNYYMGSCIAHALNPTWYCDRDKITF